MTDTFTEGTSGQDRESYTDTQDRESYTVSTTEPTVETFAEWYGNGDTGEESVSDGMGNGACLYEVDGELWYFEWTDQGFDYCGRTTREEWDQFVENYPTEGDES